MMQTSMKAIPTPTYEDNYPSRQPGQKASMIERQEPVVYGSDAGNSPLSSLLIEQYRSKGFMALDQLFSEEEVASWLTELDYLRNDQSIQQLAETITEPGSNDVRSIFAVHKLNRMIEQLSCDPRLLRIAEFLLKDKVYLHQSRLNYKPGFRGKEFYWHSDFETWHVEDGMPRMRALSMSITLTENHSTNGPLLLIPGSHTKFLACEGETPEQNFKSSLKKQQYGVPDDESLERLINDNGIVEIVGRPGSVCIFDCNIIHGSNSNISPKPRSNIFFVYNAINNCVDKPYSGQDPRPEYICTREVITPLTESDAIQGERKS